MISYIFNVHPPTARKSLPKKANGQQTGRATTQRVLFPTSPHQKKTRTRKQNGLFDDKTQFASRNMIILQNQKKTYIRHVLQNNNSGMEKAVSVFTKKIHYMSSHHKTDTRSRASFLPAGLPFLIPAFFFPLQEHHARRQELNTLLGKCEEERSFLRG